MRVKVAASKSRPLVSLPLLKRSFFANHDGMASSDSILTAGAAAMWQRISMVTGAVALAVLACTQTAEAAPRCRNTHNFNAWMAAFKKEALTKGITQQTISAALDGVTFDPAIIKRDSG